MKIRPKVFLVISLGVAIIVLALLFKPTVQRSARYVWNRIKGKATVSMRVQQYGERARARLLPYFESAGVRYPPSEVVLVGLKDEDLLELYASGEGGPLRYIRNYPILKASGGLGPKLRQGDLQVPEGVYRIESLNPNSAYHLSLRLDYPNDFDRERARDDGRANLGGDIMIHGDQISIGCLAMGDEAAEDLFILAAETGFDRFRVILSPVDFRRRRLPGDLSLPAWTHELYGNLQTELSKLPPRDDQTTGTTASAG